MKFVNIYIYYIYKYIYIYTYYHQRHRLFPQCSLEIVLLEHPKVREVHEDHAKDEGLQRAVGAEL
jgi:hypothetical protein